MKPCLSGFVRIWSIAQPGGQGRLGQLIRELRHHSHRSGCPRRVEHRASAKMHPIRVDRRRPLALLDKACGPAPADRHPGCPSALPRRPLSPSVQAAVRVNRTGQSIRSSRFRHWISRPGGKSGSLPNAQPFHWAKTTLSRALGSRFPPAMDGHLPAVMVRPFPIPAQALNGACDPALVYPIPLLPVDPDLDHENSRRLHRSMPLLSARLCDTGQRMPGRGWTGSATLSATHKH